MLRARHLTAAWQNTGMLSLCLVLLGNTEMKSAIDAVTAMQNLSSAKSLSFRVKSWTELVSLPGDREKRNVMEGRLIVKKDGTWTWIKDDGWELHFGPEHVWLSATGSDWKDSVVATDLSGQKIDATALTRHIVGIEMFLQGKWKGVAGQQDWIVLPQLESEPNWLTVVRPKSKAEEALCRSRVPSAGTYLVMDSESGLPVKSHWQSYDPADWEERHVEFSDVSYRSH